MIFNIFWTYSAENDVHSLKILEKKGLHLLDSCMDDVVSMISSLSVYPLQGQMVFKHGEDQVRSIMMIPFRILYVVRKKSIFVLRIIHFEEVVNYNAVVSNDYFVEEENRMDEYHCRTV